jgi:four helix bundle protein
MPTFTRFEVLPVWQEAIRLAEAMEVFLAAAKNRLTWAKRDQLDRASLSVSNNIAEGFERGTTNELLTFLHIARGSAAEVRSMLCLLERRPAFADLKSQISNLKSLSESCSRQLRAWADSLQNSAIPGERHLNDHSRKEPAVHHGPAPIAPSPAKLPATLSPGHPLLPKNRPTARADLKSEI